MNRIIPVQRPIVSTTKPVQVAVDKSLASRRDNRVERQGDFARLLNQELQKDRGIRFSKHAEQRLETRNISLSDRQIQEISNAVDKAEQKGIRDSLILMKDMAFIVNIPSRVVVTAIDGEGIKENIFTNIDGAVIL